MTIESTQDLILDELQGLYTMETQAVETYPQLINAASSPELKQALQQHAEQTQGQVQRLEQVFGQMGQQPQGKNLRTIQGMIADTQQMIQSGTPGPVLDAGLIGAAQKMEHLEIACYGTARTLAVEMNQDEVGELAQQTLDEEIETDRLLTTLAESRVNQQAREMSMA
ncbi:MAG: ferritin-like domain-containing protein [Armatimonadota bacterium]